MKSWLLVLALAATGAHAADDGPTPCDNVDDSKASLACSAYNKKTAETELASAYKDLLERAKTELNGEPAKQAKITDLIKAAQAQWVKTRDADCAVETFQAKAGTAEFTTAQDDCLAQKSDERSEYLQTLASQGDEGDAPEQ
jgi:uncharacterized protein YecT (DUF1311 family)